MNRLTDATHPQPTNPTENFTYDRVGNRTTSHLASGQIHDAANRLLEDSNFTYAYDQNGNLTEKVNKGTGDRTVYIYDAENQLIRVEQLTLAGGVTPVLVAEYNYDALGRRIEKVVNGVNTRLVYDNGLGVKSLVDGSRTPEITDNERLDPSSSRGRVDGSPGCGDCRINYRGSANRNRYQQPLYCRYPFP